MSKRVLVFSTAYFPMIGGAEIAIREITDRLPGWEFHLICARLKPGLKSKEKIGNVVVHRVGIGNPMDKYMLPVWGVLQALCLGQFQVVWSIMASYGGFAALFYARLKPKTKMLLTLQEGDPLEYILKKVRPVGYFFKQIFVRADAIQAISKFLADWGKRMGFKGQPEIVPNGVDVSRFTKIIPADERRELRTEMGFADADIVLVTASRLVLKNGTGDLIGSLVKLPENYKVLVIGDGEDRQKLEELTKQNGLENRVVFLGLRSHAELPSLLQSSDIFCRPSLSEGLGNSFLEAMAAGLPIIGTPVGGIVDFLFDGETGVFCQPNNPESVAKAARRIIEEPGLRDKLIKQGVGLVRTKYNWVNLSKDMERIFNALVL